MKPTAPMQFRKKDIVERIADVVMLRRPISRLGRWLDYNLLKHDVYQLQGNEILPATRWASRFKIQDVCTWQQIFISFGVPLIAIKFADGRTVEFSDRHEDLLRILQRTLPAKEIPWEAL